MLLLKHYYAHSKLCVISGSEKSSSFDCNIGVRQGEIDLRCYLPLFKVTSKNTFGNILEE